MPTVAASLPRALLVARAPHSRARSPPVPKLSSFPSFYCPRRISVSSSTLKPRLLVLVASSFDELGSIDSSHSRSSKKSILSNLIQEIEPLDVTLIQKDVPANTVDAMKRTISGMLGLLPSDQFNVLVEAFWEPLFKLFVSSMLTGYTLRNAEYRLCLERNLDISEENLAKQNQDGAVNDCEEAFHAAKPTMLDSSGNDKLFRDSQSKDKMTSGGMGIKGLGEMPVEAQEYILYLQSRLSSTEKELHDIERKNAALQMQQFVGEEKNDLLDYLRSLQPEKVAELSESTCPGLQEIIQSVVHGLLAILSPKMQTRAPDNAAGGILNVAKDDCAELLGNTSLQFQPLITISRDYLARLLFWCMLLGHYLRGLEYRLELMQLLTVTDDVEVVSPDGEVW